MQIGDADRYTSLVDEFHDLITVGANNTKLLAAYHLLHNQLAYRRLIQTSLGRPGRLPRSVDEHQRVLDLIESKERDGAESAMRSHVRASAQEVLAAIRGDGHQDLTPATNKS